MTVYLRSEVVGIIFVEAGFQCTDGLPNNVTLPFLSAYATQLEA